MFAQDAAPKSLDPRVKVELFAEHPQIVTPTGIDVDSHGRVWAIESNTHFRPEGYKGHPSDRVLVMNDTDGDGKADRIVVFTDGLKFTMSVAVMPVWALDPASQGRQPPGGAKPSEAQPGKQPDKKKETSSESGDNARKNPGADNPGSPLSVYIATRREIRLFHDDDGDDKADRSERIVQLETKGDYPHNGLAGFAFDALGWMFFGCGENLGADYKLIGSDGATISGGGEGGNIYRCRLDGTKLEQVATGFWNPHANCFDAFGRLFSVDNDPDSRPPCRLLHIIPGGDYGYRFRNGRAGLHPFTSWNGEIPGTLPMVAGTGEAPSGILAYESDGLPEDYIGNLFATSWGDHRVDRFRLKPRGASFGSVAEPLIVGGENFRPVGIACAPDGSLYFTDWVKRDYNLHGHGRVWRVSGTGSPTPQTIDAATVSTARPISDLTKFLNSKRLDIRRASAAALRTTEEGRGELLQFAGDREKPTRARIESLWSIAQIPVNGKTVTDEMPDLWMKILSVDEVGQATFRLIGSAQFGLDSYADWDFAKNGDKPSQRWPEQEPLSPDVAATLFASLPFTGYIGQGALSVFAALRQHDPFLFAGVVNALVDDRRGIAEDVLVEYISEPAKKDEDFAPHLTLAALLALRRTVKDVTHSEKLQHLLEIAVTDSDELLRRAAIQWVAEEHLIDLRPQVEAVLNDPQITADLFLATLAGLEMLDGKPPAQFDKTPPGKYVLPLVRDEKRSATVRALALKLVNPADPALDGTLLEKLLQTDDSKLRLETVRTLQSSPVNQVAPLLLAIAADVKQDKQLRAEAIAGLGSAAGRGQLTAEAKRLLLDLLKGDDAVLRSEALRSLRGIVAKDPEVREAVEKLAKTPAGSEGALAEEVGFALGSAPAGSRRPLAGEELDGGDAATGRRVFFHANGAGCFKCHTVDGRGGRVGPNLSTIGRSHSREKLLASIVDPGKEIAPQYVAWSFETTDGKVLTGMIVHENEGKTTIGDADGKLTELKTIDIVQRVPQVKSVMPEKLPDLMTLHEFRDLLAFLESLK
ncbi:MAG TPA: PVC-type heme-binding CxxCH protein [Planctomycetaceae bacterium]|jgi:putative membrane-bound dehydrogenase-like protein